MNSSARPGACLMVIQASKQANRAKRLNTNKIVSRNQDRLIYVGVDYLQLTVRYLPGACLPACRAILAHGVVIHLSAKPGRAGGQARYAGELTDDPQAGWRARVSTGIPNILGAADCRRHPITDCFTASQSQSSAVVQCSVQCSAVQLAGQPGLECLRPNSLPAQS